MSERSEGRKEVGRERGREGELAGVTSDHGTTTKSLVLSLTQTLIPTLRISSLLTLFPVPFLLAVYHHRT